jgi:hypothetical protein
VLLLLVLVLVLMLVLLLPVLAAHLEGLPCYIPHSVTPKVA